VLSNENISNVAIFLQDFFLVTQQPKSGLGLLVWGF